MKCQTPPSPTDSLFQQQSLDQCSNVVLSHSDDAVDIYHIALKAASYIGYPALVKLKHNVDTISEPHRYGNATWLASVEKCRILLEAKRMRKWENPLDIARNSGASKIAEELFKRLVEPGYRSSGFYRALCMASHDGDVARVDALLRKEADLNYKDDSDGPGPALVHAVSGCNAEMAKDLLANGAGVNEETSVCRCHLEVAVGRDNHKMVELLLESNADVNFMGDGNPLLSVTISGNLEMAMLLVDRGALVNIPGGQHGTPLSAAAELGHENVISCLPKRGAKIDVPIGAVRTPGIDCREIRKATERPAEWGEVEGYVHMVLAL